MFELKNRLNIFLYIVLKIFWKVFSYIKIWIKIKNLRSEKFRYKREMIL